MSTFESIFSSLLKKKQYSGTYISFFNSGILTKNKFKRIKIKAPALILLDQIRDAVPNNQYFVYSL